MNSRKMLWLSVPLILAGFLTGCSRSVDHSGNLKVPKLNEVIVNGDRNLDVNNRITVIEARKFIEDLKAAGFKVVIFSNNNEKRVKMFLGDIDTDYWYLALKPLPFSYWAVCKKMNTTPSKTIVMGDQLITDILGANLSGCHGIYCRQLQEKDSKMTAFNRRIEKFIWRNVLHEEM